MKEFMEYLKAVFTYMARHHGRYRSGQAYFNVLSDMRPDLAERFTGKEFDPYYDDTKIPAFLTSVCSLMVQPES